VRQRNLSEPNSIDHNRGGIHFPLLNHVVPRRRAEAGTAILITMLLVLALLSGGAVLLGLQLGSTRAAGLSRVKVSALACAEAGLASVRDRIASNYAAWTMSLCNPPPPRGTGTCVIGSPASEPAFLQEPLVSHDLDGDGSPDFVITLVDNDDEMPPLTNNLAADNDLQVFVVSTCIANSELTRSVAELVRYTPGGNCYSTQAGYCGGGGNNK